MKTTIAIVTYWCKPMSERETSPPESDYPFDHATPLDDEGTLASVLERVMRWRGSDDGDLTIAVVAVPSHRELYQTVQLKVQSILEGFESKHPVHLVGPDQVAFWRSRLAAAHQDESHALISFVGYANVRNICLLVAALTGAEALIILDDTMLVGNPLFLEQAGKYVGKRYQHEVVTAVNGVKDGPARAPAGGRDVSGLTPSSVATGGPLVLHRSLFEKVPFDPSIQRGVETDYLLNAAIFDHCSYRDDGLSVDEAKVSLCAPDWYRMRKDIVRIHANRSKLSAWLENEGLDGSSNQWRELHKAYLFRDGLQDEILKQSLELAFEYLADDREREACECIANIAIGRSAAEIGRDWLDEFMCSQRQWSRLVDSLEPGSMWPAASGAD